MTNRYFLVVALALSAASCSGGSSTGSDSTASSTLVVPSQVNVVTATD